MREASCDLPLAMTRPHSFLNCCFGLLLRLLRSNPFRRYCSCLLLPGAGQMTTYLTLAHFWPGVRKLLLTQTCSLGLPPLLMALFFPPPGSGVVRYVGRDDSWSELLHLLCSSSWLSSWLCFIVHGAPFFSLLGL